jgi:glutamate N-acetyltransferase/amino-acid N-acetyltransferase
VAAAERTCRAVAEALGCAPEAVLPFSTGVILEPLPVERLKAGLPAAAADLRADNWHAAAHAIMTTDTIAKAASRKVAVNGKTVTISGVSKGAGMIKPNMATMLGFVATDAGIAQPLLEKLVKEAADASFNCITVDGDTSTSDTILLFATGAAGNAPSGLKSAGDPRLKAFAKALDGVCLDLALQVARDGEGAEKLIEIAISGAESDRAAHRIAMAIANSPLVKTAIAGEDANWGRIVMAIGKAGEKAERDRLGLAIGGIRVARNGRRDPAYREADVMPHMKGRNILIEADVGVGRGRARVWTCDLTHRYIDINGSYRS